MKKRKVPITLALAMLAASLLSWPSSASSPSLLFSEDWESGTIEPAKWTTWGYPRPAVYPGQGRYGSYAVNNNGDGYYASGLYVPTPFDITQGVSVEFWLRGYGPIGRVWSGNDVGLTACSPSVNHETCWNWAAWVHTSAEDNAVGYYAVTEHGQEGEREIWEPLASEWHKYKFTITQDGLVFFYRDDDLKFSTTAPIDFDTYGQVWLQIQGRSVGARYYVDDLLVTAINAAPTVTAHQTSVSADEGQTAVNSGTVSDPDGDPVTLSASVGTVVNNGDGTWSWSLATTDGPTESQTVTISADDGRGGTSETSFELTVNNTAPMVDTPSVTPEPSDEGEAVTASATFSDPGVDDAPFACTVNYGDGSGEAPGTVSGNTCTGPAHTYDDNSSYTITVSVTDKDGGTGTSSATHTVNNVAPSVDAGSDVTIDEGSTFSGSGSFTDPGADTWTATVDYGDGTGSQPLELTGNTFELSHTYADNGDYTVDVCVTDDDDSTGCDSVQVTVLNVAPTVMAITAPVDPVEVNAEISASADFTDPGVLDTHTAIWDWGDGNTSPGSVNETDGSGSVSGSHTYTAAGVYTVRLIVTDKDGDSGESVFQHVVVYDPSAGFVTGGGWIDSPLGAYTPDPSLTGKANFGFVSKYKKGADVPTGQTEFQFRVADLNFHSDSYDWLVIAGARAKYKGIGTINDEDQEYKFMLTAIDADINDNDDFDVDRFRIKVWYEVDDTEYVVYDNGLGEGDDDDNATTEIGGGSIVIHSGKK